ncbi:MAG: hypothetical protein AAF960_13660 [Bacteroidota bacterium]
MVNKKSFKYSLRQDVEEVFGIEEVKKHDLLDQWLAAECELTETEKIRLEELRSTLEENVDLWNEAELKMNFIGPLLSLVNYNTKKYRAYMERPLSVAVGEDKASGTVDFLIARGRQEPRTSFFSVHEHKPELNVNKDPLGQLLIAMVAIQKANAEVEQSFPLYGAYVIGKFFYFVVFDGTTYARTEHYAANKSEELTQIFCALRQVKFYINEVVAQIKDRPPIAPLQV